MKEAAESFRQRGYAIVFIRPGEKRPMRAGWTLASQEPEDYRDGENIGLLTGALSGGLCCVDLDSPDALRLADAFLPPTGMIDGRRGKPRSHRWYRVTGTIPPQHTATCSGNIGGLRTRHFGCIDLLGTGAQAAAPPSLHPSGEHREFIDPNGEPAEVGAGELVRCVEALAVECGWLDRRAEAARYIGKIQAIEGGGGDKQTFRAASALVNGFSLDPSDALPLLERWNRTNAIPPWNQADLAHKIDVAVQRIGSDPRYPFGHLIRDGRRFDDPILLAQRFPGTWRCWNGRFFQYEDGRYTDISEGAVSAMLWRHVDGQFGTQHSRAMKTWETKGSPVDKEPGRRSVTPPIVHACREALASLFMVPSACAMPCMLPGGEQRNYIAFKNGILDLDTLQLLPHSENWFSTVRLDYSYDPAAQEPRLAGWLSDWFGSDDELKHLAAEWVGYCLTRSTNEQHFLMLCGDGNNGKTAFAAMLQAIIGVDNCSYQGWGAIGERFGLAPLVGKLLNISDEASGFSPKTENVLKSYTGGGAMELEQKYKDVFMFQPTARLLAMTNEFPRIQDKSDGFWRRLLLLPFGRKIETRVPGMDKVSWWAENACMAGILNWAIAGLQRLRERGSFTVPKASLSGAAELRRESNPARMFIDELELIPEVSAPELYASYRQWAFDSGLLPLSAIAFSREVARAFPHAQNSAKRVGGKLVRFWRLGVDWPSDPFGPWSCPVVIWDEEPDYETWSEAALAC